jgi:beta-xylosidase
MYNDGAELWHDTEGKAWMTFRRDGHSEHWPLRSKVISALVDATYYKTTGKTLRSQARQDAISRLEGLALFGW